MNSFGAVIVVLAVVWVLQLGLSLFQTKRFHQRVTKLRQPGTATAVGLAGSNWKRKVYGVLVVDEERLIVNAEKLSGITVFANLKPVPELIGISLDRLDGEPMEGIHKKLWAAFQNAAQYVRTHDINESNDEDEADKAAAVDELVDGK